MKCPNCFAEIKYKERVNNQCTKCKGTFVFEPKTHPLGLTDTYFSKTVDKLSANGTIFFTLDQLRFAVSRKRIRQSGANGGFVVIAVFTFIPAVYNNWKIAVAVFLFWACFFVYRIFFRTKIVSLKQSATEFETFVLKPWEKAHKNSLSHLIGKDWEGKDLKKDLRGFLLCDSPDAANFLVANKTDKNFRLHVSTELQLPKRRNRLDLPIFVLHDASNSGYAFFEKAEKLYEQNTEIFDIGLRPQDVKRLELAIFREPNPAGVNIKRLTNEENKWLGKGFYTPLFALKPAHLLRFMNERIERNLPAIEKSVQ